MNIRFDYLYRDAGNYKWRGSLVFSNPLGYSLEEIKQRLSAALIDGEYFVPTDVDVPLVHDAPFNPELDHEWYEVEEIVETEEEVSNGRSIDVFIELLDNKK